MADIKKKKKTEKRLIIPGLAVAAFVMIAFIFFWRFPIGYRMSVSLHGFTEEAGNIYINNDYGASKKEAVRIVNEARERVAGYFGEIKSDPVVIVCDNKAKLKKLGGDHDTSTIIVYNVKSYTAVSPEYLNVDIIAHELTHAEVHARVYKGKFRFQLSIPTWFDEGIALQNDYRDAYSEDAWKEATDNGKTTVDLNDIDTPAKFYAGEAADRRYRYIVSKYELSGRIEEYGLPALLELLDKLNQGEDFNSLYHRR
ncbi:MAG: hypothetical protein FWG32_02395 [Oscillospiraceae bacterium]|nr:hypothetical protein [Oscillospiraceae bacterium]